MFFCAWRTIDYFVTLPLHLPALISTLYAIILLKDVKVAEIDDAEWEELAEAAGLSLSFTGDECQDAWEQLWHDDTAPGYEVCEL
jgi:hypothetical protein